MSSKESQGVRCINCDSQMNLIVLYKGVDFVIRSWRCPKCGLTLIHPKDAPNALELLKETIEV